MKVNKIAGVVGSSLLFASCLGSILISYQKSASACDPQNPYECYQQSQEKCAGIVGKWSWDARRFSVELQPDGTVDGYDGGELIGGTWSCEDPKLGSIKVVWDTGFTDVGFLSGDGQTLNLVNHTGSRFDAIRR